MAEPVPGLLAHLERRLTKIEADKAAWRERRGQQEKRNREDAEGAGPDPGAGSAPANSVDPARPWPDDSLEFNLGYALAQIRAADNPGKAVDLLRHDLYQVRQRAITGLANSAAGPLLQAVIEARDAFLADPEHPSPFPYDAYQAIDRMLRQLEIRATADELARLRRLQDTRPAPPPGKTDWVRERLAWTIGERCLTLPAADDPEGMCAERRRRVSARSSEILGAE